MKRNTIITAIAYLFILLFLYTAISKLLAFNVTLFDMRRNPLLGDYALFWTVAVPITEIIISVLLFVPKTRRIGLWATLAMMIGFTGYVGVLLASDHQLPCTCGGIFRKLSWSQHLWVNVGLLALSTLAIFLQYYRINKKKTKNIQDIIAQ